MNITVSNGFGSAQGKFASCRLNALNSNQRWTSDDVALLKINFIHAPSCLACTIHARESLGITGHRQWQLHFFQQNWRRLLYFYLFLFFILTRWCQWGPLWQYTSREKQNKTNKTNKPTWNLVNFRRAELILLVTEIYLLNRTTAVRPSENCTLFLSPDLILGDRAQNAN